MKVFRTQIIRGDFSMGNKKNVLKVVVLAVVKEKKRENEEFRDFLARVREKYAELLGNGILLKVV
jgi:hypothetical protein